MARVPEPVKVRLQRDVLESNDFLEPCGFRRFRDRVGAAADLAALVRRSGSRKRRGVDQSKGAATAPFHDREHLIRVGHAGPIA